MSTIRIRRHMTKRKIPTALEKGEKAVRCNTSSPSPFLVKNAKLLAPIGPNMVCVDIGCGNGRNSIWAAKQGYVTLGIDRHGGQTPGNYLIIRGDIRDEIPINDNAVDLVLVDFVLMFLTHAERLDLLEQVDRLTARGGFVVIELYAAKESYSPTLQAVADLASDILTYMPGSYEAVKAIKNSIILRKL